MSYNVVRMYRDRSDLNYILHRGLTLEEAQAHCREEETSSSTCKADEGIERAQRFGPWFDGYEDASGSNVRVDTLKFNTSKPQVYYCAWSGRDRVVRFTGNCVLCRTRTYACDDGGNDPRGVLGDHAACELSAADYDMTGPDLPACFLCQNDTEERYNRLMRRAKRRWSPA